MLSPPKPLRLSKSRYLHGLQCHKQLWWRVHDPEAPELAPSAGQQNLFAQGKEVGERARGQVPGGQLIYRDRQGVKSIVSVQVCCPPPSRSACRSPATCMASSVTSSSGGGCTTRKRRSWRHRQASKTSLPRGRR